MLPSPSQFASYVSSLGIQRGDIVVVYDTYELGITSAPRAAWTLKAFGHNHVYILNNFKIWVDEDYPTVRGHPPSIESTQYPISELEVSKVVAFNEIKEIAISNTKVGVAKGGQILDARSYGRWSGIAPEPRPGLPSGHIPGSISVPVEELLDVETKAFLSAEQLRSLFERKGIDSARPIITSCGSGVTAAVIDAALIAAEYGSENNRRLYDGSWL